MDFSASPHVQELLADEARLREVAFAAASLALRRIAETRVAAVVVVIDDLHWADGGSIEFARHLLAHNRDMPLLCVFLTRPMLFEHEPGWVDGDAAHQRIDVRPLDKADSHELAESLLQRIRDVPEALRAIVTGGAEGNPFYMEELVKMLIDDGVIVVDRECWRVLPERLLAVKVPSTLTGVLQARLDALPPPERHALQQAAIVGHVFWDQALAAVDPAALGMLPALLHRHMVVPRDERLGVNSGEYAFQHQLLQQVTYESVLKAPRLQGHARAGGFWSARAEVTNARQVNPDHLPCAGRGPRPLQALRPEGIHCLVRSPVLQLPRSLRRPHAAAACAVGASDVRTTPRAGRRRDRAGADQPGATANCSSATPTGSSPCCSARSRSSGVDSATIIQTPRAPWP